MTNSKNIIRFKDAKAWCNGQASNIIVVDPILSTAVCHGLKTTATQTNSVEVSLVEYALNQLPTESQLLALSKLFSAYLSDHFLLTVLNDFLKNAASAMLRLSGGGRTNVLYNLAKGIGTMRPDQSDSHFSIKRMPLGLVEYVANFFAAENLQQVITCIFLSAVKLKCYTNIGVLSNRLLSVAINYVCPFGLSFIVDPCGIQSCHPKKKLPSVPVALRKPWRYTQTFLFGCIYGHYL